MKGDCDYGVVEVERSHSGTVHGSFDVLLNPRYQSLHIVGEHFVHEAYFLAVLRGGRRPQVEEIFATVRYQPPPSSSSSGCDCNDTASLGIWPIGIAVYLRAARSIVGGGDRRGLAASLRLLVIVSQLA